jgi:hypothetical protein
MEESYLYTCFAHMGALYLRVAFLFRRTTLAHTPLVKVAATKRRETAWAFASQLMVHHAHIGRCPPPMKATPTSLSRADTRPTAIHVGSNVSFSVGETKK